MPPVSLKPAIRFLDSWLAYRTGQLGLPGLSVAVYSQAEIVFSGAYGLADIDRRIPLTPAHRFAAASQSKMFTATAIMQLVAAGAIRLDDPLRRHVPWITTLPDARWRRVTIRHLLTHRGGLWREGADADHWLFTQPFPDTVRLRRILHTQGLAFDPGTRTKYSNVGFALAGQVIEAASGQTYQEYVTAHIIRPLRLLHTTVDYPAGAVESVATGYGPVHRQQRPALQHRHATAALAAATGIYATPSDLCRFVAAHFPGSTVLLPEQYTRQMQRSRRVATTGNDADQVVGLGMEIQQAGTRRIVGHGGHMGGHMSATFFDPRQRLAVAVMANCRDAPATEIVHGIFGVLDFFAAHASAPMSPRTVRCNARLHNALNTIQVVATPGKTVLIDPDDWDPFSFAEELERVDDVTFVIASGGSMHNEGERLVCTFAGNHLHAVRVAGITLWPDE